ncbi:hypothetical protein [Halomarina rubra]|uniref:PGF-CTERM sorting domain-containing protein n=1 Tax=Halomarina rubra TaxID=2071873 RepID=A0ABD6AV38_9EURY|nr:hypothetical protein [Halomarina rubra]
MEVVITLSVPNGMQITGASDTFSSGAGMATARFTVNPGAGIKDIRANVYSSNAGQRTVTADITYWPVGHKDMAKEMDGIALSYNVEEPTTPTAEENAALEEPAATESNGDSESESAGIVLSETNLLIGVFVALLLVAIVGLAARGR